ncbi:16S rRNA (guanine(966)-N(2))-methyltransferase RsmD [Wohlfahrtiimonas chitiniclastica]|nr:16S rRNA (guanine(966)-N(2))-methyltransferase RsmD [Wohlfahrtiimonas chitiniclastica]OYQ69238.1 16S rRNA (guanine(966)-N(2))-methyltransferase RsmD [Wohlfahrtiimonas chitiniclastica]OYQ78600.1 16S rRNA (guanine(966)-N(2))-methyltransferase RsmD [Wohlfahrtiimonas chitiniclastica]OYQ82438.1 16S rRNA (guanine(966)-N(2))-methyltransferase RsmD [Wohlfahrtiimonas chitiniclastica]OYQ83472.1 16S rRNA (guanine(966)-N(2))-methyltransferase RsmD [Wohlfahrtiimonas chitiniclastica]
MDRISQKTDIGTVMKKTQSHTIRIIGGDYRSRLLTVMDKEGLRPTGNRMRETLFNWLQPIIIGQTCLDLFAGSGALGMEALSRGAKSVTFVEKDLEAFATLKQNVMSICKESERYQLLNKDAVQVADLTQAYGVIFLDPPFGLPELLTNALTALQASPHFASVRYLVIERSLAMKIEAIEGFSVHREMNTKESNVSLWVRA